MLINWFTVIAQIVNFLILIGLLRYFLYDRIIQAMDERERRIQSRLEEAEKKKQQAEQESEAARKKHQEIDEQREQMLSEAKKEAETRRKELTQQVKEEVADLRSRWEESLRREQKTFIQNLRRKVSREVYSIARKTLNDLADSELENSIIDVFLRRLKDLDSDQKKEVTDSIYEAGKTIEIQSAFDIDADRQNRISDALHKQLVEDSKVKFSTSTDLIAGIVLKIPGRKIAWDIESYLEDLEHEAMEALSQLDQTRQPERKIETPEEEPGNQKTERQETSSNEETKRGQE